jgi:hypothetical protein
VTTADLHAPAAAASVVVEEVAFVAVVAAAVEASFAAEEKLVDTLAAVAVEEETPFDAFAAAAAVGEAPFGSSTVAADFDSLVHTAAAAAAAVRPVASFENSLAPQMAVAFVAVYYWELLAVVVDTAEAPERHLQL